MIGCVKPKATQTGLRSRMRIWRWKTTRVSVSIGDGSGLSGDRRGGRVAVAQRASGEGQEDVVERRAVDVDAGRRQPGPLQSQQQRRNRGGALVDRDMQRSCAGQRLARGERLAGDLLRLLESVGIGERDLD